MTRRRKKVYFSENLKFLREKIGLNQSEIADKFYITRSAVGMWENGIREPDIEMLVCLADFFEVTLDQLVKQELYKGDGGKKDGRIKE